MNNAPIIIKTLMSLRQVGICTQIGLAGLLVIKSSRLFPRTLLLVTLSLPAIAAEPSVVSIIERKGKSELLVNNQPFQVNGVGMGYTDAQGVERLAAAGGNAFRTWDTQHLDIQLQAAFNHDVMVLVGLDVGKELQGFDYSDEQAVDVQHQRLLDVVQKYKDHPNVLGWIMGNEPNLMVSGDGELIPANPLVYAAIGRLARDIQRVDPDHPVTVAFAFTPTLAQDIDAALQAIPDLDFLSLQAYGALTVLPRFYTDLDVPLPYMITEYGPLGHWEMPATTWGREIEELSGDKAVGMRARMDGSIINDPTGKLLGSFAFLWGQKQERTPTWYGLFLKSGEKIASVDELIRVWTGRWPDNRAPSAWTITLDDKPAGASVTIRRGQRVSSTAVINDPENDALDIRWELLEEVDVRSHGGHFEQQPDSLPLDNAEMHQEGEVQTLNFDVPDTPGDYRLFVYAVDGNGGAATANIPFRVVQ